jgi:CYTH domain-containing protein
MEIERKFLIKEMPDHLEHYPVKEIEQGYLCTDPVVRIRRSDDSYYLTYKGKGLMAREEYNLPLNAEAYEHLKPKADGRIIRKKRYLLPLDGGLTLELDVFADDLAPLVLAEVEFESEEAARSFQPPDWLGADVTFDGHYHNSAMSRSDYKL